MNADRDRLSNSCEQTDILIVGSGIAGLSLAAEIAERLPECSITVLAKNGVEESNTRYAQGGIAVVTDPKHDSLKQHVADTLRAGDGLCNPEIVNLVVEQGPARLNALIRWGAHFDKDNSGRFLLSREGGHSASRVVHFNDSTGYQISKSLLQFVHTLSNVKLLKDYFVIDLIKGKDDRGRCCGVYVIDTHGKSIKRITAKVTVLATGGAGQVYETTTNPTIATGDGIAMAYRVGADIKDMEFVQFHPTALRSDENPSFLISEAVRGFGGYVVNGKGERILFKYDARGELASRDIISKALHKEINAGTGVYIDCRHLPAQDLIKHFPTIHEKCLQLGVDITRDLIPVVPAAHYVCGGIVVDKNAKTSVANLYAIGECACTGLHGANRLASNSLLEALVFAHYCSNDIVMTIKSIAPPHPSDNFLDTSRVSAEGVTLVDQLRKDLKALMTSYVGIVRSTDSLYHALKKLNTWDETIANMYSRRQINSSLCELRNLLVVAKLITTQSLQRKENRGTFFNEDLVVEKKKELNIHLS